MKAFSVYIAAPFEKAPLVRGLHAEFVKSGVVPTSHWATLAREYRKEADPGVSEFECQAMAELCEFGIRAAKLVVALTFEGIGGEMFAECARALALGTPVLWVGERTILSSFHPLSRRLRWHAARAMGCVPQVVERTAGGVGFFVDMTSARTGVVVVEALDRALEELEAQRKEGVGHGGK